MIPFARVLVLFDAQADPARSAALERALALTAPGAAITLAALIDAPSWLGPLLPGGDAVQNALTAEWQTRLDAAAAPLRHAGRTVQTRILSGRPRAEAVAEAERGGYDLVLKDVHPDSSGEPGPIDLELLRSVPTAAALVRPRAADPAPLRVLAAVDPTPPDDATEQELNLDVRERAPGLDDAILAHAAEVSRRLGAELHVVQAQTVPGEELLRGQAMLSAVDVEAYLAAAIAAQQQALQSLLARHEGLVPPERVHSARGPAAETVLATAQALNAELIVLGTVARTGLSRFVLGNTAESIARSASATVLTVRLPG